MIYEFNSILRDCPFNGDINVVQTTEKSVVISHVNTRETMRLNNSQQCSATMKQIRGQQHCSGCRNRSTVQLYVDSKEFKVWSPWPGPWPCRAASYCSDMYARLSRDKPGDHTVQTRSSGHLRFHHDKCVNNLSEIQIELVAYVTLPIYIFLSTKFKWCTVVWKISKFNSSKEKKDI